MFADVPRSPIVSQVFQLIVATAVDLPDYEQVLETTLPRPTSNQPSRAPPIPSMGLVLATHCAIDALMAKLPSNDTQAVTMSKNVSPIAKNVVWFVRKVWYKPPSGFVKSEHAGAGGVAKTACSSVSVQPYRTRWLSSPTAA